MDTGTLIAVVIFVAVVAVMAYLVYKNFFKDKGSVPPPGSGPLPPPPRGGSKP